MSLTCTMILKRKKTTIMIRQRMEKTMRMSRKRMKKQWEWFEKQRIKEEKETLGSQRTGWDCIHLNLCFVDPDKIKTKQKNETSKRKKRVFWLFCSDALNNDLGPFDCDLMLWEWLYHLDYFNFFSVLLLCISSSLSKYLKTLFKHNKCK